MGVKKNFWYSSILTTANYVFPMITFPYITRVLGPSNIGICNFVDSIIHYFLLFSMLGIGSVGVREIAKAQNNPEKRSEVFSSLLVINLATTLVALLVLFFCVLYIPLFKEYSDMMWIGALKILFNSLLIEWFFKGIEEFKYITTRSIIVRSLYVIGVFVFVRDSDDYNVYYLLMTLMIVINAFLNIHYSRKFVKFSFSNISISPFIVPIAIMGLYAFLTSMYTSFNTMYLGLVAGETEVGYYSVSTRLFSIFIALFTAFTGVMLPRMSSILSEGKVIEFKSMLSKSVSILFSCAVPIVIFAIIYAKEIVFLLAGHNFEGAIIPLQICMPLLLIIGYEQIIIIQGLMAMDKNSAVLLNSVCGSVVGLILCILLMSHYKSIGASIAWCISELAVLCSASYFINKYINIKFPFYMLIKSVLYYTPMLLIILAIHSLSINVWLSVCISLLFSIIYFFIVQFFLIKNSTILKLITSGLRLIK